MSLLDVVLFWLLVQFIVLWVWAEYRVVRYRELIESMIEKMKR